MNPTPDELMMSDLLEERGLNYLARFMRGEETPPEWLLDIFKNGDVGPLPLEGNRLYRSGLTLFAPESVNYSRGRHESIQMTAVYHQPAPPLPSLEGREWLLNAQTRQPDVTWESMLGIDRATGPDRTVTAVASQDLETGQPVVWLPDGRVGAAERILGEGEIMQPLDEVQMSDGWRTAESLGVAGHAAVANSDGSTRVRRRTHKDE